MSQIIIYTDYFFINSSLCFHGRNLGGVATAYISGSGIDTFVFGYSKPENAPTPAIAETVTVKMTSETTTKAKATNTSRRIRNLSILVCSETRNEVKYCIQYSILSI